MYQTPASSTSNPPRSSLILPTQPTDSGTCLGTNSNSVKPCFPTPQSVEGNSPSVTCPTSNGRPTCAETTPKTSRGGPTGRAAATGGATGNSNNKLLTADILAYAPIKVYVSEEFESPQALATNEWDRGDSTANFQLGSLYMKVRSSGVYEDTPQHSARSGRRAV